MGSKFSKGVSEFFEGAGNTLGSLAEGTLDTVEHVFDGTVAAGSKLLEGKPLGAAEEVFNTTGKVISTGVDTTVGVVKGSIDMAHGVVQGARGARADVNQIAGDIGHQVAGETGRKVADIITFGASHSSSDADDLDGSHH